MTVEAVFVREHVPCPSCNGRGTLRGLPGTFGGHGGYCFRCIPTRTIPRPLTQAERSLAAYLDGLP